MSKQSFPDFDGVLIEAEVAEPQGGNGSGLIILEDPTATLDHIQAVCKEFSDLGYIAVCPLLPTELDADGASRVLLSVLARVRSMSGCSGKIGVVGFGHGSFYAFTMAARSDVDCVVTFGTEGVAESLSEIYDIRMPLLLHMAEETVPTAIASQQKMLRSLKRNDVIIPAVLSGVGPRFYRIDHADFDAQAARESHQKTSAFLAQNLNA